MRDSPDRKYTRDWLQYERQQPMYDESINDFYENIFKSSPVHRDNTTIDEHFIKTFENWLKSHEFSRFNGIDSFP